MRNPVRERELTFAVVVLRADDGMELEWYESEEEALRAGRDAESDDPTATVWCLRLFAQSEG